MTGSPTCHVTGNVAGYDRILLRAADALLRACPLGVDPARPLDADPAADARQPERALRRLGRVAVEDGLLSPARGALQHLHRGRVTRSLDVSRALGNVARPPEDQFLAHLWR